MKRLVGGSALRFALLVLIMTLAKAGAALAADDIANASTIDKYIDLAPFVKVFETDQAAVEVPLPADASGATPLMKLTATGTGAVHRWALFTVANPGLTPVELTIAASDVGFWGSGVVWPAPAGPRIQSVVMSSRPPPPRNEVPGLVAFPLSLDSGLGMTVAFELKGEGVPALSLWQRTAFADHAASQSFQRGAMLGIAILLALIMLALYSVRRLTAFPSGFVFAAAAVCFIGVESGYLPLALDLLRMDMAYSAQARAMVECALLLGLILCLVTFPELRRRMPVAGNLLLGGAGAAAGLVVYAFLDPLRTQGIARMAFGATAVAGLALIWFLFRNGHARAQATFPAWITVTIWTGAAAASLAGLAPEPVMQPALKILLVLVLLTMAFSLAQFAFSHGFLSRRFFEESGRRALALTGAQQYVWDWQVDEEELYVGDELEKALGTRPGYFAESGGDGFTDLVHPMDRSSYEAAVLNAQRRGKGAISQDFRLKRGDGLYRWFQLKARVMPGPDGRPMRLIGTLADITADKRSEERLLSDAVYDRVTGLPNKGLFIDRLSRAMVLADNGKASGVHVLVLDLDRFKTVNDGLGNEAGDALLNATGRRLSAIIGPDDTVARLPGDQFALIFIGSTPKRDVIAFADNIRKAISRPIPAGGTEVFLTASIGIAAHDERGRLPSDLLRDASIALYEAKKRGKETVEMFRPALRDDRSALVSLESDLRRAVERAEIEVVYQPIARLENMDLAGFEALMRWRHPQFGLLGPESFIALAEQSGLIREIGRAVLGDAARQLGIWQRAFRPGAPLFVAVNLSSSQLMAAGLAEEVKAVLQREGLKRDTLKIEVTESAVMENPEMAAKVLEKLKAMGVGLACDDFGTGYSSLSNLRRLPFDTLKVDKSFVAPDAGDERAAAILAAIIGLAHELGLRVVAEGIESQEHVDRLGALGCDFGQGFFIGEPMTAKQVADALSGIPYSAMRDSSAIKALWEKAAAAPVELPPLPPSEARASAEAETVSGEPVAAVALELPPLPRPETPARQPDSAAAPPLGAAPMAPRLLRPASEDPGEAQPKAPAKRATKKRRKAPSKTRA